MDRRKRYRQTVALMSMLSETKTIDNVDIASFDGSGENLLSLIVGIDFVQAGWTDVNVYNDPVYGGGIEWNQLLPVNPPGRTNPYIKGGLTFVTNVDGGVSVTGTFSGGDENFYVGGNVSVVKDHVYLCFGRTIHFRVSFYGAVKIIVNPTVSGAIATAVDDGYATIYFRADNTLSEGDIINETVYAQLFDLTQMFGAGNEPLTVEEFKALFPNDYYPYNVGEKTCVSAVNGNPYKQYTITFPSVAIPVYSGALDVVKGKLTVTNPDTDPVVYDVTPTPIQTFAGENNVWADTGKIIFLEYEA